MICQAVIIVCVRIIIMINKVTTNSINSKNSIQKQPQFKGLLEAATSAIQLCEANPMINVAVLDLSTAIIPRTIVESETNPYAGFEAFRRESSGLIINCMIPGLIVAGIAKMIGKGTMVGKTGMADCWANEDTINLVTKYWKESKGATNEEKVAHVFKSILNETKGVDGKEIRSFEGMDFSKSIKILTDETLKTEVNKDSKKTIKSAIGEIVDKTGIAENIKIKGHGDEYFSQSLGDVLTNTTKILKEFTNGRASNIDKFAENAKRLITRKSLLGLGVIIPLALSAQPINRWITEKTSGQKGAPIYKDFTQSNVKTKSQTDKSGLFSQKLISAGSMIGVALLSIGKKPGPQMAKNISQFKGIFPSMDQARLISTATFVSRMMSSQDKNDLREATVRDIATFSAFYFLGDYVAKAIATGLQKATKITLINDKAPLKEGANLLEKLAHWTKNTAMKSSAELAAGKPKQMRALCQIGNIAFSLVALGLLIPKLNRKKTDKVHEKELMQMAMDKNTKKA